MTNKEWLLKMTDIQLGATLVHWSESKQKWMDESGKHFEFYTDAVRHSIKWLNEESTGRFESEGKE